MKHEDTFNVHLAFLLNTALLVSFLVVISLGHAAHWFQFSTLGNAPTTLNSSPALAQD